MTEESQSQVADFVSIKQTQLLLVSRFGLRLGGTGHGWEAGCVPGAVAGGPLSGLHKVPRPHFLRNVRLTRTVGRH